MGERKVYSEGEFRAVCNESMPVEGFVVALSLMQRLAMALESIAESLQPVNVIGEAPYSDGLGVMECRPCPECGTTSDAHLITCTAFDAGKAKSH
jgi:hypothetical protein